MLDETFTAELGLFNLIEKSEFEIFGELDLALVYSSDARPIFEAAAKFFSEKGSASSLADVLERLPQKSVQWLTAYDAAEKRAHAETGADRNGGLIPSRIEAALRAGHQKRREQAAKVRLNRAFDADDAEAKTAALAELTSISEERMNIERPPFSLSLADLAHLASEPIDWLVNDILIRGSVGFLGAYPKQGKTWSVLDLLVAHSVGGDWWGRTVAQGRSLYVAAEGGMRQIAKRFDMLCSGRQVNFHDVATRIQVRPEPVFIDTKEGIRSLRADIRKQKADLAVIDPLARCHTKNENLSQDMDPVMTELRQIANREGVTILILHHASKSGGAGNAILFDPLRGSNCLRGFADFILGLKPLEGGKGTRSQITSEFRDTEPLPSNITVEVDISQLCNSAIVSLGETEGETKRANKAFEILEALQSNPEGLTQTNIRNICGMSSQTVKRRIKELLDYDKIEKIPNTRPEAYRIRVGSQVGGQHVFQY